jgi:polar amino acid transport system permease protein
MAREGDGAVLQPDALAPGPGREAIDAAELKVVPRRRWGRWIAAAVIAIVLASLARSAAANDRFQWDVVGDYLFSSRILDGLVVTLQLTVIAMVLGIILGVVFAVMRQSPNPLIRGTAWTYIWFFRGTPLLVQLLFWSFIAAVYPVITLGIPFTGVVLIEGDANVLITPFLAAVLGLSLNEGAYMAEIVRGGLLAVPHGQVEAAQSIGMTRLGAMRRIVLPQAMRVIIPPTGNETITMLKNTALVSVIAYAELLYAAQLIYAQSFEQIPLLIVVSIWYLVVTSILSVGQHYLERRYSRGVAGHTQGPTIGRRLLTNLTRTRPHLDRERQG